MERLPLLQHPPLPQETEVCIGLMRRQMEMESCRTVQVSLQESHLTIITNISKDLCRDLCQ